jgi:membrane protein DedA with SNARE-associated domain
VLLASISESVTSQIASHGVYAVFLLSMIDAVFPAASELVMLYAGAAAAGAFSSGGVTLFGVELAAGWPSYLAMALAGTLGYLLGSIIGWGIGRYGGRPLLERHGRWLHVTTAHLDRAERWFARWDVLAVFFGRVTPVVRSFISIPAGIFEMRFAPYVTLTAIGAAIWAFAIAGVGWALGSSYERFNHGFRYADYVVAAGFALLVAYVVWRKLRSSTLSRRDGTREDPAR